MSNSELCYTWYVTWTEIEKILDELNTDHETMFCLLLSKLNIKSADEFVKLDYWQFVTSSVKSKLIAYHNTKS